MDAISNTYKTGQNQAGGYKVDSDKTSQATVQAIPTSQVADQRLTTIQSHDFPGDHTSIEKVVLQDAKNLKKHTRKPKRSLKQL